SDPVNVTVVDKSGLEKAIKDGNAFETTDAFKVADKDDQQSLVDAIKHGEDVKNDPNATQAQVDAAQKAIEDAMNLIKTKFAAGRYTNADVNSGANANHHAKTNGQATNNKQAGHKAGQLPQTGNDEANMAVLGLAAASFAMMLGLKKKRD
ncbi:MAG: LPXTG cell wall anchor domain-containing protein, partial [Limosilactobacillus sp.]|nr:LPXTG cell wall anchor domain-containing protein [Limosilactobacillus sp.]